MEAAGKTYIYHFIFPDGRLKIFRIALDATAHYLPSTEHPAPEWTRLSCHRCPHCRLPEDEGSDCPVAVNIAELIAAFHDISSYERCMVTCVSDDRTVSQETDVQDGLRSILGIIMATSACPALDILRPMAWFHLPFGSIDESLYRSASTYLLRQYFLHQTGAPADFSLLKLKEYYQDIERVNLGILKRVRQAAVQDADLNAIAILNSLAQVLGMEVDVRFEKLRPLFF